MPQNLYDDPDFFAGYSQFRRSREGLAGAPEWPTLRSMLPPLPGLRVLDLGCGFGAFARWAGENGAASVLGIDLSEKMLARAHALTQNPAISYRQDNIERLALPDASFDLVYSSLALHYVPDFEAVCSILRKLLAPGGHLVFSVEHPLFTAPGDPRWRTEADGSRVWPLNGYLLEGERITEWITPGVVKYHRPMSRYVNSLLAHGLHLTRLEEWGPSDAQIAQWPELAEERERPTFLLMAARSGGGGSRNRAQAAVDNSRDLDDPGLTGRSTGRESRNLRRNMHILILGGTQFVGRHILHRSSGRQPDAVGSVCVTERRVAFTFPSARVSRYSILPLNIQPSSCLGMYVDTLKSSWLSEVIWMKLQSSVRWTRALRTPEPL
jgi:SAM-dependent methyltransferase